MSPVLSSSQRFQSKPNPNDLSDINVNPFSDVGCLKSNGENHIAIWLPTNVNPVRESWLRKRKKWKT